MNEKLFSGFYCDAQFNIADLEMLLYEMRNVVSKRASVAYKSLIQTQIERIVDEISLNRIPRPDQCSILEMACNIVQNRISYAGSTMSQTEYCLYAGLQIMSIKIGGEPKTLLKIIAPNDIYTKHLSKIKELIPYEIYSADTEKGGNREKEWYEICDKYSANVPFVSSLTDYKKLTFDAGTFNFRSPAERAREHAIEKVMNHLLSCYAGGKEITPDKLMEYTLASIDRLSNPDIKNTIEYETDTLIGILPNITLAMITQRGNMQNNPEENTQKEEPQPEKDSQPEE